MKQQDWARSGVAAALVFLAVSVAHAGPVTLTWDPNPESDIAGYVVSHGLTPGSYPVRIDVGKRTAWTLSTLSGGTTYHFVVQAYNSRGEMSAPSAVVTHRVGGEPFADQNGNGIDDAWEALYGVSSGTADDDGDGISNAEEFALGTDPTLPNVWYLAEGATGSFIERLALLNARPVSAEVSLRVTTDDGRVVWKELTVPGLMRVTVDMADIPGLATGAHSTEVIVRSGGVAVERTMFVRTPSGDRAAGHTAAAQSALSREWTLAEGDAGFFDTWVLLSNPSAALATADVTFLRDDGVTVSKRYDVAPASRLSIWTNQIADVRGRAFSMHLSSNQPIGVERAMYFGTDRGTWRGAHASAGVKTPARDWFVAEGHTGALFDMWLLLANPQPYPVVATLRYLTPHGQARQERRKLAPTSRLTIHVNELPELPDTEVSVAISASDPIVAERSMYWPGGPSTWTEAHNSVAATQAGRHWLLAEGEQGGPQAYQTYILLANPTDAAVTTTVTIVPEFGGGTVVTRTLAPRSRLTVWVGDYLPGPLRFGAIVQATGDIVVERSMYWNADGVFWRGGTNEVGIRLR